MAEPVKDILTIIFSKLKKLNDENSNTLHFAVDMLKSYYLTKIPEKGPEENKTEDVSDKNENNTNVIELPPDFVNDYSKEVHCFCFDLLKDGNSEVVMHVSSFFSTLAKFKPYNEKMLEFDFITDMYNLMTESSSKITLNVFHILESLCSSSVNAQKKIVELQAVSTLVDKFIEIARNLDSEAFIEDKKLATQENIGAAGKSFHSLVSLCPEMRSVLEKKEVIEKFICLLKDFFATKPDISERCCSLMTYIAESKEGIEVVKIPFFTAVLELEEKIIFTLKEVKNDEDDVLYQNSVDMVITLLQLLEFLLQTVEGCFAFFAKGGFECFVRILRQTKNESVIPKLYDVLVLLTLTDDNTAKLFETKEHIDMVLSWLDSDSYTTASSAALIIGNIATKKERSEFFASCGCHKKLLVSIQRLLTHKEEVGSKCSDHLLANLGCLKNILVPQESRKSVVDSSNVDKVCETLIQLISFEIGIVVSKSLVVTKQIVSCNPENICKILSENETYLGNLKNLIETGSSFGVDTEAIRLALSIGTFSSSTAKIHDLLTQKLFTGLTKKSDDQAQMLLTEVANYAISNTVNKNDAVVNKICNSGLLEFITKILKETRIMFPFLYSVLNLYQQGIRNGYKEKFIVYLNNPETEALLTKFAGLKQSTLDKVVEELLNEIKN